MAELVMITGGMKSGKSAEALRIASRFKRKLFVATAEPFDDELKERIERHKKERDHSYTTVEEPLRVGAVLKKVATYSVDVVVVDCLTLWMGNIFHKDRDRLDTHMAELLEGLRNRTHPTVVVTNELGMGVVPSSVDARLFVDQCGRLNRLVAELADRVILMVSGIPVCIKGI